MGYDTTAIFISGGSRNHKGYCGVEATLEMGCIAYGEIAKLMDAKKFKKPKADLLKKEIKAFEEREKSWFTADGNYTEEMEKLSEDERKVLSKEKHKADQLLESQLPYIYHGGTNSQSYADVYGDIFMVVSLDEMRVAVIKQQAKLINEKSYEIGYRRFNIILKMIEEFRDKEQWGENNIKIILWGH